MKRKIFILFFVLLWLFLFTSFAGSIDKELMHDDASLVFIGKVDDYTVTDTEDDYPNTEYSLTVTPLKKLKGDVKVNKPINFEKVDTYDMKLTKDTQYFFGYTKNELYIWELDSYDNLFNWEIDTYTRNSIILKERHNDTVSQGVQEYLNGGIFEKAEEERLTLGKNKSFADYIGGDLFASDKITFTIFNQKYIVDKERFVSLADEIQITNVKNEAIKSTNYDHVLFVQCENDDGTGIPDMFAAVAPYGEVDKLSWGMSRLMASDYTMEKEDIEKLYYLLPENVQKKIPEYHKMPDERDKPVTIVSTTFIIVVALFIIVMVLLIIIISKMKHQEGK